MTDIQLLGIFVSIAAAIFGIVFGITTWQRNRSVEDKNEAKETGQILTEIGYMKSGVDDIKRQLEKQDERQIEFSQKLYSVEASTKSAHKRIDNIEEHMNIRYARD